MASEKTKGIVLHALKYSDTSAVVTIYTERFGRAAYMVYGVGGKRAVCRPALLQPLSLVELEVVHRPGKDLQRIREMRMAYPLEDLPFNPVKNSIALFLSEVLYRVLRRSEADGDLYAFLERSVLTLDGGKGRMSGFHLLFLLRLTRYLGCEPNCEEGTRGYFDLLDGVFRVRRPAHVHYLLPEQAQDLLALLRADFGTADSLPAWPRSRRNALLESLLEYYRLHVPDFNGVQSLEVLQSLFD